MTSSPSFSGPTPYPDVNMLLQDFLEAVQAILEEKLLGFYLYGSLSLGDFDPGSSDVDFLIVTTEELSGKVLDHLREMHATLAASGNTYAQRLEGSYISRAALQRYDPDNARHPSIGIDWEFQIGWHGSNWIIERYIIREHGVIVWGPSPRSLIDPISPHELRTAVHEALEQFWQKQLTGPEPEWLRPHDYQAFAVLTAKTLLCFFAHHEYSSSSGNEARAYVPLNQRCRLDAQRPFLSAPSLPIC